MASHPPKKGHYTLKDLKGEDFSIETRSKKTLEKSSTFV
jgi:hypothetical protein